MSASFNKRWKYNTVNLSTVTPEEMEARRLERYSRQPTRARAISMLGGRCAQCGVDESDFHIDHIIPIAGKRKRGLSHREAIKSNGVGFQLLCIPCHSEKTKIDMLNMSLTRRMAQFDAVIITLLKV
jgi:5-methylcytosine-specific restriction endonuclease McrA